MQIYGRPKGEWGKLARKYRSMWELLVGSYRGSPIIELDGQQYMEVEYFCSFGGTEPFPNVNVRGVIVLRNGQSAENNPLVVRKIVRLGTLLLDLIHKHNVRFFEHLATFEERDAQAEVSFSEEIAWFRQQRMILCEYVSKHEYQAFVRTCEQKLMAMQHMSVEASKVLRVMSVLLQREAVPAALIEALNRVGTHTQRWNVQNSQALVERGDAARQLYRELSKRRDDWTKEESLSKVCERALRVWQTIAEAAAQTKQRLEETNYAELAFEQRETAALQKRVSRKLAVYRAPLVAADRGADTQGESALTDEEVDRIVASLPPLPERLPWRSGKAQATRVAARLIVALCMLMALGGIAFSIWRMSLQGPSCSAVGQALFFISWLLLLPQYLKRF